MHTKSIVALSFLVTIAFAATASADPQKTPDPDVATSARDEPAKLSLFTSAGYLTTAGGNGGALSTGVRYMVGRRFALGFDLGYGIMATQNGMQDRWWFMPSMAVVFPARIASRRASFDLGVGLGLGTSSGYGSWDEYAAHPLTATWEFQLEPAVRAHAIASLAVSRTVEVFARAEAAALVLPHGSSSSVTDSTWILFSLGTRFSLL